MRSLLLVASLLCLLPLPSSALTPSDEKCQDIIEKWLWRGTRPRPNPDNASLAVSWDALDSSLADANCSYDHFWLELWRGSTKPAHGNASWYKRAYEYNLCKMMNMEEFTLHASLQHSQGEKTLSWFPHVVEKQYILRLCPCGKPEEDAKEIEEGKIRKCDCESTVKVFCSDQLSFAPMGDGVMKYCLGNDDPTGVATSLQAPAVQCNGTILSGSLPSCTSVQDYDKVIISLHKVDPDVDNCSTNHHEIANSIDFEVNLARLNLTHGRFLLETHLLAQDSTYCLLLKLEHPYCQVNLIAGENPKQPPLVCNTVVAKPLKTLDRCGSQQPLTLDNHSNNLGMILFLSFLMIIIVLGGACLVRSLLRRKQRTIPPVGNHIVEQPVDRMLDPPGDIFLLYFPESDRFEKVNVKLREWLFALGSTVYDLSDDKHAEDIISNQEQWSESKLLDPNTRVLLVNSPLSAAAAGSSSSSSNAEGTPLMEDNVHDLRRNALRVVQAQLVGQYKKLCVVTYSEVRPSKSSLKNLTPGTDWLFPENLDQVRGWVLGVARADEGDGGAGTMPGRRRRRSRWPCRSCRVCNNSFC